MKRDRIIPDKFLSRKQVADMLGLSVQTIDRRIKDKTLESIKFGGSILIPIEVIDKIINQAMGR